jgi:hypothetical protein
MTNDHVSAGARAAALHLSAEFGAGIVVEVEEALDTRTSARRPDQYFDPMSLGGLIVAAATLAWQIYRDLKQRSPSTPVEVARTVRIQLEGSAPDAAQLDRLVEVAVSATLRSIGQTH